MEVCEIKEIPQCHLARFILFCLVSEKTHFTSQFTQSWVKQAYKSTWEIVKLLYLLMIIIGQEKLFCPGPKGTKVLTCGGVVGADKPLWMGSSSRKSLCGLADGSKWGSGQCPKALRRTCDFLISFLPFFQLGKKTCLAGSTLLSRSGSKFLKLDHQVFVKAWLLQPSAQCIACVQSTTKYCSFNIITIKTGKMLFSNIVASICKEFEQHRCWQTL